MFNPMSSMYAYMVDDRLDCIMVLSWYYHGILMVLLWYYYGIIMVLLCIIMVLLRYYYGITMVLLWYYYGTIMSYKYLHESIKTQ